MVRSRFEAPNVVAAGALPALGATRQARARPAYRTGLSPAHPHRRAEPAQRGMWVCRLVRLARVTLAACLLPLALSACAAPTSAPGSAAAPVPAPAPVVRSVHVVSHGWHTGLVLRADDVSVAAWPARVDFPNAAYLEVGWGDRAYYRAADPGAWLALKAVAWPAPGVLHVVAVDSALEHFFAGAEIIEIGLSEPGMQRLLDHLRESHELDAAGRPIALGPGLYGHSRFYASRERFHLFKTCNVWIATALHAAGVPVAPALAITSGRLMAQLRPLGRAPGNRLPATAPTRAPANSAERP